MLISIRILASQCIFLFFIHTFIFQLSTTISLLLLFHCISFVFKRFVFGLLISSLFIGVFILIFCGKVIRNILGSFILLSLLHTFIYSYRFRKSMDVSIPYLFYLQVGSYSLFPRETVSITNH